MAKPIEITELTGHGISLSQKIMLKLHRIAGLTKHQPNVYSEKHFHFDPEVLTVPDNVYLQGYWQSEKYFKEIGDIIRQEFSVGSSLTGKNQELAELITSTNSVSVHVRRGDYVADPNMMAMHEICDAEYYTRCVEKIRSTVKAPHFFVFSDESAWVGANMRFPFPTTVVDHNAPDRGYEDMRLMSLCRHNILANSSFSWWGAWLNTNPSKVVIAPQEWFKDTSKDTKDLIPDGWIRI